MQLVLFLILALVAIAGAAGVVLSKNAVHSALSLLVNFATLAMLYILLHAQFLAVVQVIVYAGAIVVLFLFVTMLIGGQLAPDAVRAGGRTVGYVVAVILGLLLLAGLGYLAYVGLTAGAAGPAPEAGSVQAIGRVLFTDYLLPFELVSVLLLVAMIGAVVLARKPR